MNSLLVHTSSIPSVLLFHSPNLFFLSNISGILSRSSIRLKNCLQVLGITTSLTNMIVLVYLLINQKLKRKTLNISNDTL